jgi:ribosomal protein L32
MQLLHYKGTQSDAGHVCKYCTTGKAKEIAGTVY